MLSVRSTLKAAASFAGVSFAFTLLTSVNPANAATLTVGSTQTYKTIQAAMNVAKVGDTINIMPGVYGCATVSHSNMIIQGTGAGVIIQGSVCGGKGLLNVPWTNTTVRNITFKGATSSDGNGAGIRMQGTNLTVENSIFKNNQDGILTDANSSSTIKVTGSTFDTNGACVSGKGCAHGIYAGHVGTLDVQNSTFNNTQAGHSIKSRANNTIIMNNTIKDGTTGTASYNIDIPNGGAFTITGNKIEKGPKSSNGTTSIALAFEGNTNPAGTMLIANNTFQNDLSKTQAFITNRTGNAALVVSGNVLSGYTTKLLAGAGTIQAAPSRTAMLRVSNIPGGAMGGDAAMANFAGTQVNGSAASAMSVPEPSSLALFGSAVIGLGLFFGMKRKETRPR